MEQTKTRTRTKTTVAVALITLSAVGAAAAVVTSIRANWNTSVTEKAATNVVQTTATTNATVSTTPATSGGGSSDCYNTYQKCLASVSKDADLVVSVGRTIPTSFRAGQKLNFTITIKNQGDAESGSFMVRGSQSVSPSANTTIGSLFEVPVSNIPAGGSTTVTATGYAKDLCSIHTWCSFYIKAGDGDVTRGDNKGNLWAIKSFRGE